MTRKATRETLPSAKKRATFPLTELEMFEALVARGFVGKPGPRDQNYMTAIRAALVMAEENRRKSRDHVVALERKVIDLGRMRQRSFSTRLKALAQARKLIGLLDRVE